MANLDGYVLLCESLSDQQHRSTSVDWSIPTGPDRHSETDENAARSSVFDGKHRLVCALELV